MPYADPEQAKDYQRTYRRSRRAGDDCTPPGQTQVPVEFRLQTASDVLALLGEQAEAVLNDAELGTVERARTICLLGGNAAQSYRTRQPRRTARIAVSRAECTIQELRQRP